MGVDGAPQRLMWLASCLSELSDKVECVLCNFVAAGVENKMGEGLQAVKPGCCIKPNNGLLLVVLFYKISV